MTHEELREQLHYDPATGHLTWRVAKPRVRRGGRAGSRHPKGHREIIVCGFGFREHRLIWWWMTGEDPGDYMVDHKNRRRSDNRWRNLRLATQGQNYVNSKTFGPMRGIMRRGNKYRVRISYVGRRIDLTASTLIGAKRLRNKIERQLYGEFACIRR